MASRRANDKTCTSGGGASIGRARLPIREYKQPNSGSLERVEWLGATIVRLTRTSYEILHAPPPAGMGNDNQRGRTDVASSQ